MLGAMKNLDTERWKNFDKAERWKNLDRTLLIMRSRKNSDRRQ